MKKAIKGMAVKKPYTKAQLRIIELCDNKSLNPGPCEKCGTPTEIRGESGLCWSCVIRKPGSIHTQHCSYDTCRCYPGIVSSKGRGVVQ